MGFFNADFIHKSIAPFMVILKSSLVAQFITAGLFGNGSFLDKPKTNSTYKILTKHFI